MTITITLQPEIEKGLLVQAAARGVSLADYLQTIVQQAQASPEPLHTPRTGQTLIDACAKVRGLLTVKKSIRFSAAPPPFLVRLIWDEQLFAGYQCSL